MDINGFNNISNSFLNTLTDAKAIEEKVDQDKFENMLKDAMSKENDEALKDACAEFESYYLNKVFSEMRKSIPKTDLFEESQGRQIYEDMLYENYAKEISSGKGAGLKEMLYKQLKK